MATVTGLTADRMLAIEGASVIDGDVVNGNLILTKHDGTQINAGSVIGPAGPPGPAGFGAIPGEIRMWSGSVVPAQATFGKWVWADGGVYSSATYPLSAGNIAPEWRTFGGASDPGAGNFRVPDLRGLTPVGLDAMPGGGRANRMTRAVSIVIAGRTGEEMHAVTVAEMPAHAHAVNDNGHTHGFKVTGLAPSGAAGVYGSNEPGGSDVINNPMAPAATGITLQNTGNNQGHENVQPSVFIPYIVCLHG